MTTCARGGDNTCTEERSGMPDTAAGRDDGSVVTCYRDAWMMPWHDIYVFGQ